MNKLDQLIKKLEILKYQMDLVDTLKGQAKRNLESSVRDLYDLTVLYACPYLEQLLKKETRKETCINLIDKLRKIREEAIRYKTEFSKTLPIK